MQMITEINTIISQHGSLHSALVKHQSNANKTNPIWIPKQDSKLLSHPYVVACNNLESMLQNSLNLKGRGILSKLNFDGNSQLKNKPQIYFLDQSYDAKPTLGVYVLLTIDPKENNILLSFTQGTNYLVNKLGRDRAYKLLNIFANKIVSQFGGQLDKLGFTLSNSPRIAELSINNSQQIFNDQFITQKLNDLLDIYSKYIQYITNTSKKSYWSDDYYEAEIDNEVNYINNDHSLNKTEKEALIKARVGQGKFRLDAINLWSNCCCVSGLSKVDLLIASHIKPWAMCENKIERLDPNNSLLLNNTYDALFDKGYISFDDNGKIKISKQLTTEHMEQLNINRSIKISRRLNDAQKKYMNFHRDKIFIV